ncbi:MAG: hypothetical protein WBD99_02685 [Thermodesulfobacteriota bacterium]
MTTKRISIHSWNRFYSRNLSAMPEVMGKQHSFPFESYTVLIKLPDKNMVDRGKGHDKVASVAVRRASDNEPIEFYIHKVDVEVSKPASITVPAEVLERPPNAFELFNEDGQKSLESLAQEHKTIAERAFDYWIRIVRWVCDNSRIGRDVVAGFTTGWTTYLMDSDTKTRIWAMTNTIVLRRLHVVTNEEWTSIQSHLSTGDYPPIYVEFKHDAEENMRLGHYARCVVDLAIACETFLRYMVIQRLPPGLSTKVSAYVEDANIRQYIDKFFPEILQPATNVQFRNLTSNLHSLFDRRNKLVHMGRHTGIDELACRRWLDTTKRLLAITGFLA